MTFAPDEPALAAQMGAVLPAGTAWQCLRCAAYVPGPPVASGPAAKAPYVARGPEIRSQIILRVFAIERFLRGILAGVAVVFLWRYRHSQETIEQKFDRELPFIRSLSRQLGFDISHSKLFALLQHAFTLSTKTLTLVAIGLALYMLIELVESIGLWLAKRWGEYFAMVATSLGLPLEIYDLTRKVTATAAVLFAINLALVLYLVFSKRLFGVRGGKRAYDARLASESVLEAAEAAAARQSAQAAAATQTTAGAQAASATQSTTAAQTTGAAQTTAAWQAPTATAEVASASETAESGPR